MTQPVLYPPRTARAARAPQRLRPLPPRHLLPLLPGRALATLWWLHPLAAVVAISLVYASFAGFDFSRVVPRAWIPGPHYAWGGALLLALALGIVSVNMDRRAAAMLAAPRLQPALFDLPRAATGALLAATVLAYVVWFQPLLLRPQLLLDVLAGRLFNVREIAPTSPGLTTMTQFGVAYAIAHAALLASRVRPLAAWERLGMLVVLVLGTIRMLAWGERLALIELLVPWAVAWLAFAQVHRPSRWRLFALLPLAAPLLLYLLFTGTEYFRSWTTYQRDYDSIWAYTFERLRAYYATASNNGIGLLVENTQWPQYSGRFVAEWLYMMPVVGDALRDSVGDVNQQYAAFLERYARPELNNPSGLFTIVFDIGYAGSMLYFLAVGVLIGRLWVLWRAQTPAGVLCYPVAVLFLVELLRFNYLAATRFFPVALALVFLWSVARPLPRPPGSPRW
jgi:hypothetical protein